MYLTGPLRWIDLSYFDIVVCSVFFQFCLYVALRLAHGGFTLGELALVCFGGLSLGTELLSLTRARVSEQVDFE